MRRLVLIGTTYDASGNVPGALEADADSEDLAVLNDMYAAVSPDGADHWPVVVQKVGEM